MSSPSDSLGHSFLSLRRRRQQILRNMAAAKAARHPMTIATMVPAGMDLVLDEAVGVLVFLEVNSVEDVEVVGASAAATELCP